jgi:desampylase
MITLNKSTIKILQRWAARHEAIEICGMVWQHLESGVQTVWALQNTHSDPSRYYAIDHLELQDAFRMMEKANSVQLAFYHSHPGGKPDPSEADMEGALNVGLHYLILYPQDGNEEWGISAWDCIEMGILVGDDILVGKG